MGGDINVNHRKLGEVINKDYHTSWYLEEDERHPKFMYITQITLGSSGVMQTHRYSFPLDVLKEITPQLDIMGAFDEDNICPECGGERGKTNDCPTCNG